MITNNVLNLQFKANNGKKYTVKVKEAKKNVSADEIKKAADVLVQHKVFDFDGEGSAYHLDNATYVTTNKTAVVEAPNTKK